jgi:AcrR family transcriptional regulator
MGQPVKRGYRAEHRARVAKLQVEATRQVVTDSARYLFERDGYHRTTIRAIAAEAGLAEATVYFHFGSKPAILQAIVDRAAADAERVRLDEGYSRSAGAVEMIETGFRSLRRHLELTAGIDRVIRDAGRGEPGVRTGTESPDRRRHSRLVVERLESEGLLRAGITLGRATDVLHLLSSLEVFEILVEESGWKLDEYERWLSAAALALLTTREPA